MKKNMKIAMIATMLLGLVGPVALASQQATNTTGDNQGKSVDAGQFQKQKKDFLKELNLTPEQKQKLQEQRQAARQANQSVREQMKTKMQELHAEIAKPEADPVKIKDLVADINTLKGNMFSSHVDGILAMKAILTPEQFAKFEENRKKHGFGKQKGWKQHHGEGHEEGLEGGPSEDQTKN